MKPGATTLREASMRLPTKRLNWFFGAIRVIQPFSMRTEWLGKTAAAFPAVSTVPFSTSSDIAGYLVTGVGRLQELARIFHRRTKGTVHGVPALAGQTQFRHESPSVSSRLQGTTPCRL